MLVVILAYDQLLFRPLVAWSAKFRFETTAGATAADPWMLRLMRRTRLLQLGSATRSATRSDAIGGLRLRAAGRAAPRRGAVAVTRRRRCWFAVLAAVLGLGAVADRRASSSADADLGAMLVAGARARLHHPAARGRADGRWRRLIWVPIGVWLGLRPVWARRAQPVAQFLAAFPANLLFPPFVLFIVHFQLNADIWLTPLMVLGTQWYILFNVIAGAAAFPGDLREAAGNFRVGGWLWWRKVMHPGHLSLLRDRRDHRLRRLVERRDRRRGGVLGRHEADGARPRRLYRRRRPSRATWRASCWAWW